MVWTNIIASLTSGEGKASPEVLKEKNKDGEVSRNKEKDHESVPLCARPTSCFISVINLTKVRKP